MEHKKDSLDGAQIQAELEVFKIIVEMGELVLQSGGEIFRAHETMLYAAQSFGLSNFQPFIIANGIFASVEIEGHVHACQIRAVPLTSIVLCRLEAINDLSRKVQSKTYSPEQLRIALEKIRHMQVSSKKTRIFASGCGSACFCYLFQGSVYDAVIAFVAGVFLYWFLLNIQERMQLSRIVITILGSCVSTLVCVLAYGIGLGHSLDSMIIGSIFPLVPGVPLTNAVRNLLENDYLSGLIRLVDALLTAACIAIGVNLILTFGKIAGIGI